MDDIDELTNDFINTLLAFLKNIALIVPKSVIGTSIKDIEKVFADKSRWKKIIDNFCLKVLQYKDKIDSKMMLFLWRKIIMWMN